MNVKLIVTVAGIVALALFTCGVIACQAHSVDTMAFIESFMVVP